MSRLIVKNLPAYLTQSRLREHFESKDGPGGTLTDVKVVLKPDGISRRFGFIGYKSDAEAAKAKSWFDRTFVDSSRIFVEIVEGVKDAPTPRPNKRSRTGPSPSEMPSQQPDQLMRSKPKASGSNSVEKSVTAKDDQLDEFLQVMKPRTKKGPSWADEQPVASSSKSSIPSARTLPSQGSEQVSEVPEGLSDMDWLRRHTKQSVDAPDKAFEQSDDEADDDPAKSPVLIENEHTTKDPIKATILQTARLFLRNLSYSCTSEELLGLFGSFGSVAQVHIPLDPKTQTQKGFAYVSFADPLNAVAAYERLDKTSFQGRLLHILPAVDRKGKMEIVEEGKQKSVKAERDAKRKSTAGKEFNWSMLYMNVRLLMYLFAINIFIPLLCTTLPRAMPSFHLLPTA